MQKCKYIYRLIRSFCLLPNPLSDAGTSSFPPTTKALSELKISHVSVFRVPNTNITLKLGLYNEHINKVGIGRIILYIQLEVKNFVEQNSATSIWIVLYDSSGSDVRYTGCFFGLK